MATKNVPLPPIVDWRDVPRERIGEGMLTGHRVVRDLMSLATRNPEDAATKIRQVLQQAVLADVGEMSHSDDDMAGRKWAAQSILFDFADHIVAASQRIDFEAKFAAGAARATEMIESLEPTNKPGLRTDQRSRRTAAKAIKRAMKSAIGGEQ